MIPSNDSMCLLSQFVEEMDLSDLYMTYSKVHEHFNYNDISFTLGLESNKC